VDIYLAFSFLPHFKPATRVAATADNRLENEFSFCLLVRGKKQRLTDTQTVNHTRTFKPKAMKRIKWSKKCRSGEFHSSHI